MGGRCNTSKSNKQVGEYKMSDETTIGREEHNFENFRKGIYHEVMKTATGAIRQYEVVKLNADDTVSATAGTANEEIYGVAVEAYKTTEKARVLFIGEVNLELLKYHSSYTKLKIKEALRKCMIVAESWHS